MLKKIRIALLMICLALCAAACAEGFEFTLAGEGTVENPYLIATKEDLLQFAAVTNHEELYIDYYTSHFQLTADVTLNDCSNFDAWDANPPENVWTPIGYYHNFRGVFDGNGHKISGLYIDQAVSEYEYSGYNRLMDKFGLFGNFGGEIKNLSIENAFVHPKYIQDKNPPSTGILVGSNSGAISGCSIRGVVICEGGTNGGIVGGNYGEINDCTFEGKLIERTVYVGDSIGGIAGFGGIIRNCSVNAQLICEDNDQDLTYAKMGGIAGFFSAFSADKLIENCTFEGEIRCAAAAGGIVGSAGTIGAYEDVNQAVIRNCTNNGNIIAKADAGGIVGCASNTSSVNEVHVDSCINRGEIRSLDTETCAVGGIVGSIDARHKGPITIANCTNEADLRANMPGGIVGRLMQSQGNVRIEKCTNKGAIEGEGFYAAGILSHIQQWGGNWNIVIDQCVNEGDINVLRNAGGIVCFAYSVDDNPRCALTISNCINRGDLRSEGTNNYMGGILGVDALAYVPVNITGCINEGDLEYTSEVLVDAETLSGALVTLSRTSGGIVGYAGTAPYLTLNSGTRTLDNIGVKDAYLSISDCSSTGLFLHKEARFADDVDAAILENWKLSGQDNVLDFFIVLEGGIVGTIADEEAYSVKITDCSYTNIERELDDWNRFDSGMNN